MSESIVLQKEETHVALLYPDVEEAFRNNLSSKDVERIMEENRVELNKQIPAYSQIASVRIYHEEFEKTPKKSIKRYLYQ